MSDKPDNWKATVYIIGGGIGLAIGMLTAYLYTRTAEEARPGQPPAKINTGDAFRIGMTALGLVRQVSELASKK